VRISDSTRAVGWPVFWLIVVIVIILIILVVLWVVFYYRRRDERRDLDAALSAADTLAADFAAFQLSYAGVTGGIADVAGITGATGSTAYIGLVAANTLASGYLPALSTDIAQVRRRIAEARDDARC